MRRHQEDTRTEIEKLTLLDAHQLEYIQQIFARSMICWSSETDDFGNPVTIFRHIEDNSVVPVRDPQLGNCVGFYHCPNPAEVSAIIDQQKNTELALQQATNTEFKLPIYNIGILQALLQTLTYNAISEHTGTNGNGRQLLSRGLAEYNLDLQLTFDENGNAYIIVIDKNHRIASVLNDDDFSLNGFAGFIVPNGDPAHMEEKLAELNSENGAFFLPLDRDTVENVIHEFELMSSKNVRLQPTIMTQEGYAEKQATLREAIRFLDQHLREQGVRLVRAKELIQPDELERQLPLNQQYPLADAIFVANTDSHISPQPIENLAGWEPGKDKHTDLPETTTAYGSIYGIAIVDNGAPLNIRKKIARDAGKELKTKFPSIQPQPLVLTVDQRLLDTWKTAGTPFIESETAAAIIQQSSISKNIDYGRQKHYETLGPPEVELHTYEPGGRSHIGGTQLVLVMRYSDDFSRAIMIDMGLPMDLVKARGKIGNSWSYSEGSAPWYRTGTWDTIRRRDRLDLHIKSFKAGVLQRVEAHINSKIEFHKFYSVDEFIVLEILHRLGEHGFLHLLEESSPVYLQTLIRQNKLKKLLEFLNKREEFMYKPKTIFDALLLSHAHQDHTIGSSFVRDEITRAFSPITRAFLHSDHVLGHAWQVQDQAVRKLRELPKVGSAYQVFEYPHVILEPFKTVEMSPDVFVTPIPVNHSIPGCLAFFIEVFHKGKLLTSLLYTGDIKDGQVFQDVQKLGGAQWHIIEGTNPPSSAKESAKYTEADVARNFEQSFREANDSEKLVVVDLAKNATVRLENIIRLATAKGRMVLIHPKIATRIYNQQLITGVQFAPSLNLDHPNIALWKAPKDRYTTTEEQMFRYGYRTPDDVVSNPSNYVVIRENEQFEKLDGVGSDVIVIDSTYGPYTLDMIVEKRYQSSMAKEYGMERKAGGFHSSGHNTVENLVDEFLDSINTTPPSVKAIVDYLEAKRPEGLSPEEKRAIRKHAEARLDSRKSNDQVTVLPNHTQRRGEVADMYNNHPNAPKRLRAIGRVGHPNGKFTLFSKRR